MKQEKKLIKELEEFIREECISQLSSVTQPIINKLDFDKAKKQFNTDTLEKGSGEYFEYQDLLRHEKAWNNWNKLKKFLDVKK